MFVLVAKDFVRDCFVGSRRYARLKLKLDIVEKPDNRVHTLTDSNVSRRVRAPRASDLDLLVFKLPGARRTGLVLFIIFIKLNVCNRSDSEHAMQRSTPTLGTPPRQVREV